MRPQIPFLVAIDPVVWLVWWQIWRSFNRSVGTKAVWRRWLEPALILSPACSDRWSVLPIFLRASVPARSLSGAWSPDGAIIRCSSSYHHRFSAVRSLLLGLNLTLVSLSHPDPPCSWEIMWLVLSRGYVWETSSFGVVGRVLEVSVAAREGSRDSIHISLLSLSPGVVSLALGPLASSKVASSGEGMSDMSHYSACIVG
ncbi:hypothetical protein YC2023_046071 [Brassica napus]